MKPKFDTPPQLKDKQRLVVIAFFVFCLFSFLIGQFFKTQLLEHKYWLKKAKAQHQFTVEEPFKRGVFYSAETASLIHEEKPKMLVVDLPVFHLYLDPEAIPENLKERLQEHVSYLLALNGESKEKVKEQFYKKSRSRKLANAINKEKKEEIEIFWKAFAKEEKLPSNSLYFVPDYKRCYPYGKFLGQVLHTIRDEKDSVTKQAIPTGGLEYYFNAALQGKPGKRKLMRSPRHPLDRGDVIEAPTDGNDIYLTIDHHIQVIAEEEVEKAVRKAQAKSGWAVVMNPENGEILALAQYPFFHPSEYKRYYSDPKLIHYTKVRAVTDCFEPGSTFKPISFAIALKANEEYKLVHGRSLFDTEEKIDLNKIVFPGRKVGIKDVSTSRYLNMDLALQKSSNIYIAGLIQKVVAAFGEKWYRNQLEELFGFGKKTNIELPSESAGFLPTPGKMYKNGKLQWSQPTPGCLAIGYNLMVNAFQMLKAYALLANGGYEVQPTLIKKIVDSQNPEKVVYERPVNEKKQRLSSLIIERLIQGMKYVTKPGGTAFRADVPGYSEVGKTSSSEKIIGGQYAKNVHFSSFIGFAPAKKAKLVIFVGIDEPVYSIPGIGKTFFGGKCAAPAFSEIAKRSLKYLGIPCDDPYGYPKGDPRAKLEKSDMFQEMKTLNQLFKKWHQ